MAKRSDSRHPFNIFTERKDLSGMNPLGRGRIVDLSLGGALYKEETDLSPGQRFLFVFEIQNERVDFPGEVVRTRFNPDEKKYLCGIKFSLAPIQKERLERWLRESQRGSGIVYPAGWTTF